MSAQPVLKTDDLHVWFDLSGDRELHAVQGVSFELRPGERMGLVGESGCGKTTTILALMGLLPASASVAGRVYLDGEDVLARGEESVSPHRWRDVAMVFQGAMNAFNPVKTIGMQIAEPMELHGTASGRAARAQVRELLELVGISGDRAERYPHEFSGGMRQRAAIALALACQPKVLLADEPTTALDVMVQAQILELLVRLTRDLGLSMILVTHDLPVVAQVCDRAAVMYAGEIVEMGEHVDDLPRPAASVHAHAVRGDSRPARRRGGALDPGRAAAARSRDRRLPVHPPLRLGVLALPGDASAPDRGRSRARGAVPPERPPGGGEAGVSAEREALLEVDGLVTRYPVPRGVVGAIARRPKETVHAVEGVSFTIAQGEMVALVGESGCGKTTTAQTVVRMVESESGVIRFRGREITRLSARSLRPLRREIQMIYQDPYESLDPRFTVRDTIEEPLVVHHIGRGKKEREAKVREALERAGLTPPDLFIDRFPHELSGGQRQRVAIAASLVLDPKLLVADEPVSMLDVSVRAGILSLLDKLRKDGMGILMITHDLSTAAHFADRIAVMYLGRIVEEGPARDVVRNPQHPYTRALITVVPKRDPREQTTPQILTGETPNPIHVPSGCRFHPRCPVAEPRCSTIDPSLQRPRDEAAPDHRAACIVTAPGPSADEVGPDGDGAPPG